MAVQQNKKSPSKRGMHRSHNALNTPGTAIYRGKKVMKGKSE